MENKYLFENLSDEDKQKVRLQYSLIPKLIKFSNYVTPRIFIKLFGEQIGNHLSEMFFDKYNRDFLSFYNYLSTEYKSVIICNIELNDSLYA